MMKKFGDNVSLCITPRFMGIVLVSLLSLIVIALYL